MSTLGIILLFIVVAIICVFCLLLQKFRQGQINHVNQRQPIARSGQYPLKENCVTHSSGFYLSPFHEFIQKVIDKFEDQRHGDYAEFQFAVLFLSSDKTIKQLCDNMEFRNTHSSHLLTDSNCKTFPPDANIYNYVTARPHKSHGNEHAIHAEDLLLGKLDTLMNAFGESRCQTIVLYTWLLPCKSCKKKIVKKLGHLANKRVILAYTSKMLDMEQRDADKIEEDLKSAGIDVRKEWYPARL